MTSYIKRHKAKTGLANKVFTTYLSVVFPFDRAGN